jgi:type II secretory pathway component GspD/PulD (secretin)
MNTILFALLILSPTAYADSFSDKCPDIAACAKYVGELLGQKYVFDAEVKGRVLATPNVEIGRENAELLFTSLLYQNGYSRVPLGQAATYQIARQRDARDLNLPVVKGDARMREVDIPATWDLVTLIYKTVSADNAEELARKMEANAYLSTHTDEVCPANWSKGKKTLKPNPQMAGKVFEALNK